MCFLVKLVLVETDGGISMLNPPEFHTQEHLREKNGFQPHQTIQSTKEIDDIQSDLERQDLKIKNIMKVN